MTLCLCSKTARAYTLASTVGAIVQYYLRNRENPNGGSSVIIIITYYVARRMVAPGSTHYFMTYLDFLYFTIMSGVR